MTTATNFSAAPSISNAALEAASAALVTLRDVSKRYANGMQALSGVDLTVGDGEFVSLLGPSGCGKSTLLRLIAGLGSDHRRSDRMAEEGARFRRRAASGSRLRISGADADALGVGLQQRLSAVETSARMNRKEPLPTINDALAMVGLERFADAYPRQLSGGMKMRVSIARALVTHPRVLLLDEPFAALDEITRFRLNNDLLSLWQKQRWTVIFVTHSVFESVYLSQRIVVMQAGPGRVASQVWINAPYPRDKTFRTSSVYNEYCRITSGELSRVVDGVNKE